MAQMKFKSPDGKEDDWTWLQKNLKKELDSFQERKETRPELVPKTYLFFTNIILTPTLDSGTRDQAEKYVRQYTNIIPHIFILGLDEIRAMLDNNPNVARSYAAFITPGDVLTETISYLEKLNLRPFRHLIEYAQSTFNENHAVRLEQAGSVSDREINIRNVYTDLEARSVGKSGEDVDRIAASILAWGNKAQRRNEIKMGFGNWMEEKPVSPCLNLVLIGNAGQGKSTLCQYICQIYRAALLQRFKKGSVKEAVSYFDQKAGETITPPDCERFPVLISLKDYAAKLYQQDDLSVLSYICNRVNEKTGGQLTQFELRELLSGYSWIFFFDGLDEVPASSNRAEVLSRIQSFLNRDLSDEKCDCVVVCTSRPQGYDSAFSPAFYRHYELKDLSQERCKEYIEKLLKHIENNIDMQEQYRGILYHALESPLTARLMTTPLYTSIIVVMVKAGGTPPTKRYDLFHDYCEIICKREREKHTLPQVSDAYDWILPLHAQIGFLLQAESETRENAAAELSKARCEEIIIAYLKNEGYGRDQARQLQEEVYGAVTTRLPFLAEIVGEREHKVLFPLRSIQEYFAAEWIMGFRADQTDKLIEILEKISVSAYWRNVFLFAAGFYAKEDKYAHIQHELSRICQCNNGDEDFEFACVSPETCSASMSGSFLAIDMLDDNLFRKPKDQTKYMKIAANPLTEFSVMEESYDQLPDKLSRAFLETYVIPAIQADVTADSVAFHCLWRMAAKGNAYAKEKLEELVDQVSPPKRCYHFLRIANFDNLGNQAMHAVFRWRRKSIILTEDKMYFLSCYVDRFTEIKDSSACSIILREVLYGTLSFGNKSSLHEKTFMRFENVSQSISILLHACEKIYKAFSANLSIYANEFLRFCPISYPSDESTVIKDLSELFTENELPELAAFVDFLVSPSQQTLTQLLTACHDLPKEDQIMFGQMLGRYCNWLLQEIGSKLAREPMEDIIAYYKEFDFEACKKKEEWIKQLIDTNDYINITKHKLLNVIKFGVDALPRILRALGKDAIDDNILHRLWAYYFSLEAARERIGVEITDFCQQYFPLLFQNIYGQRIAVSFFSQISLDDWIKKEIEFPSNLPEHVPGLLTLDSAISKMGFDKLHTLINLDKKYLKAYSLFPFMIAASRKDFSLPELPDERAQSCLTEIRASGNRLALLGCILHILNGDISEALKEAIWEDVRGFLLESSLTDFWRDNLACFSLDGSMFIYKALTSLPEAQRKSLRETMSIYRQAVRLKLEAQPVNTQELMKLAEEAHRDD